MVEACGHDDCILLIRISAAQDFLQVVQIFGIANGYDNISRSHPQRFSRRLFVAVHPELVEALRLTLPFFGNLLLRVGKEHEKGGAEQHSGAGGLILSEEIRESS